MESVPEARQWIHRLRAGWIGDLGGGTCRAD